jgi:hypothetical protein
MKKILDLKLFGLVAILTVALVFIGVNFMEGQVQTLGKPDKPDNPTAEQINFYGDLQREQVVYGCCPNAGPFPAYTMTLPNGLGYDPSTDTYKFSPDTYEGWLFINYYGAGRDQKYKVQFWWDYHADLGIEIIGGEIHKDKKTKVLTVTFTNDECVYIKSKTFIQYVNFTLERYQIRDLD